MNHESSKSVVPFEQMTIEQLEDDLEKAFSRMVSLLLKKRQSYGPSNLVRFGPLGIVIRASDKIDRLTQMINADETSSSDGDSMEDAWRDLIGYGVLGLLYYQHDIKPHLFRPLTVDEDDEPDTPLSDIEWRLGLEDSDDFAPLVTERDDEA